MKSLKQVVNHLKLSCDCEGWYSAKVMPPVFLLWRRGELRAFSDASAVFNATGIQSLTQRRIKCVDNEDFWKK
jgi:hypothetical protein